MKKKKSLFVIFVISLVLLFCGMYVGVYFGISAYTSFYVNNYINDNIYTSQEKAGSSIWEILFDTTNLHVRVFSDENIDNLLSTSTNERQAVFQDHFFDSHPNSDIYLGSFVFFDNSAFVSNEDIPYLGQTTIDLALTSPHHLQYEESEQLINNRNVVIVSKKIIKTSTPNLTNGVAFYFINESAIIQLLNVISPANGHSFLINNDGYVIAHPTSELTGKILYNEDLLNHIGQPISYQDNYNQQKSVITTQPLTKVNNSFTLDWHIVTIIDYQSVFGELNVLQVAIFALTALFLLVAMILAIHLSSRIIRPINDLAKKVSTYNLDGKDSELYPVVKSKNEIAQLENAYDEMTNRIYLLVKQSLQDVESKRQLELESLQMQINPHFLYNTLDTIAWMAKIQKEKDIERLVIALARFYRVSLHKGDKYITVKEEIEIIQHFVDIELIRYPEKFIIEYTIDPQIANNRTLKLLLQPIVENAIKHGMAALNHLGNITVSAEKEGNDILFKVADDGSGFDANEINLFARKNDPKAKGGYGLFNVNERIRLEFGKHYGLKIFSQKDLGTTVEIRVPIID